MNLCFSLHVYLLLITKSSIINRTYTNSQIHLEANASATQSQKMQQSSSGFGLLRNSLLNKGMSFTTVEREKYKLGGLLPAGAFLRICNIIIVINYHLFVYHFRWPHST